MTIDEAMTKLEELAEYYMSLKRESYEPALRLGIEALEEIKRARENNYRFVAVKLPSEGEK